VLNGDLKKKTRLLSRASPGPRVNQVANTIEALFKAGHCCFQNRPLGVETGQYLSAVDFGEHDRSGWDMIGRRLAEAQKARPSSGHYVGASLRRRRQGHPVSGFSDGSFDPHRQTYYAILRIGQNPGAPGGSTHRLPCAEHWGAHGVDYGTSWSLRPPPRKFASRARTGCELTNFGGKRSQMAAHDHFPSFRDRKC
jgi:hypothetical protein